MIGKYLSTIYSINIYIYYKFCGGDVTFVIYMIAQSCFCGKDVS